MKIIITLLLLLTTSVIAHAENSLCIDEGDGNLKIGNFCDNFEDNDEGWTIFSGKNAMSISTVQAIGIYSFLSDAGNELEYYNYSANLSSFTAPHSIIAKVYDNGTGNANTWVVYASNGTSNYFIGVDTTGSQICPSANTSNFCYRISTYNTSAITRPTSAGWVTIRYEFNGTHVNGYINENQVFSNADTGGLSQVAIGNSWASSGTSYFDEVRIKEENSGNFTSWKNWTEGNVTYQIGVNATTPANTNYSVYYRMNATGDFILLASNQTGNQTIAISTKYQNTDVRLQLRGNETATPEIILITYYSQAEEEESTSTTWTTGIGGQFFQNRTIGRNHSCINQGDGKIGICYPGTVTDNFADNNTLGWNETGNLNGTWTIHNGELNQSGAFASYMYQNISTYENMSVFIKFKEYNNLSSYIDASDLRGNLSRVDPTYGISAYMVTQFSIGSPTQIRAQIYAYNGSQWLTVNNTATKTRHLNEWNYAAFFVNGTYYRGYLSNISYADALSTLLSSGTSSQWLNGTNIQFGGLPDSTATISVDEVRVVELDAQGNPYLQGNVSMNYTVPASQYAKNITVNGSYPAGTNYSLRYRQNATGNYISVGGVKTADATIELPTPYYQNIDIMVEMNASTSDTLWIDTITVGTSENNGGISLYNTGYQYVLVNDTLTNTQLNSIWSPTWIIGWNSTSQKWEGYKSGWNIRASRITNKGDAIGIKVTINKSIILTYNTTYNWTLIPGQNFIGLETSKTLSQINTSVNTACEVNLIEYIELETQTSYLYTCGQSNNASIQVKTGEGIWMNTTATKDIVRVW